MLPSTMNCDSRILKYRKDMYERKNVFLKQYQKHALGQCNCAKTGKTCNCKGSIDLSRIGEPQYLDELYHSGTLDTIYNICQSITQSQRCTAGKSFEDCFARILEEEGFQKNKNYACQVSVTHDHRFTFKKRKKGSHKVDFVIPCPMDGTPLSDKYIIISTKTCLRERYLQDLYLGHFVLISLEKKCDDNVNIESICVKKDGNELDLFIKNLKKRFLENNSK